MDNFLSLCWKVSISPSLIKLAFFDNSTPGIFIFSIACRLFSLLENSIIIVILAFVGTVSFTNLHEGGTVTSESSFLHRLKTLALEFFALLCLKSYSFGQKFSDKLNQYNHLLTPNT